MVFPRHDVATVGQPRHCRLVLLAALEGVDRLLQAELDRAVDLGAHVDGDRARFAGAAVAISHADAHRAAGNGVAHRVGVAQVLDHLLHGVHCGIGVEQHRELGAIRAVARDGADGHPLVAHRGSHHAHLPRAGALADDAELVLRVQALQPELVLRAVAGEVVHLKHAAVEVG